jgi:hypothetical protein
VVRLPRSERTQEAERDLQMTSAGDEARDVGLQQPSLHAPDGFVRGQRLLEDFPIRGDADEAE